MKSARGVTLIELLITVLIGSIAFMAIAAPFMAERRFWRNGTRQTEAQRDAQLALYAMALAARESTNYTPPNPTNDITFIDLMTGCSSRFYQSGPLTLDIKKTCAGAVGGISVTTTTLINGAPNRSQVTSLAFKKIGDNQKLVHVQVEVTYGTEGRELLDTELHLRNAS